MCRSVSFIASARLQIREHCIVEAHPDNRQTDLRLEEPFASFREHMDSVKLSPKVPWLVVLYKNLQEWSQGKSHSVPQNYKEKSELKDLIRGAMSKDEENYEEAIKAVNSSFSGGQTYTSVRKLLEDPVCKSEQGE